MSQENVEIVRRLGESACVLAGRLLMLDKFTLRESRRAFICVAITAAFAIGFAANAWAATPPTGVFQGILNWSWGATGAAAQFTTREQ